MTNGEATMGTLRWASLSVLVGVALIVLAWSGTAESNPGDAGIVPLHNDRAGDQAGCPDVGDAWHFVLAPNNDAYAFKSIVLMVDGTVFTFDGRSLIRNGGQRDNVFVRVPDGYDVDDLQAAGSFAEISPEPDRTVKFVLSGVCTSKPPTTTTKPPTTTTKPPTTTTKPPSTTTTVVTSTTVYPTTTLPSTTTVPSTTIVPSTTTLPSQTTTTVASGPPSTTTTIPSNPTTSTSVPASTTSTPSTTSVPASTTSIPTSTTTSVPAMTTTTVEQRPPPTTTTTTTTPTTVTTTTTTTTTTVAATTTTTPTTVAATTTTRPTTRTAVTGSGSTRMLMLVGSLLVMVGAATLLGARLRSWEA